MRCITCSYVSSFPLLNCPNCGRAYHGTDKAEVGFKNLTRHQMVLEFHEKYKLLGVWNKDESPNAQDIIGNAAAVLKTFSELHGLLAKVSGDGRYFRSHLSQEELGELLEAIASGDRVKIADALADLCYILEGIAITYNIPLEECFREVHRSNMSKTQRDGDLRMKDKGSSYSPPQLGLILERHDREQAQ